MSSEQKTTKTESPPELSKEEMMKLLQLPPRRNMANLGYVFIIFGLGVLAFAITFSRFLEATS